MADTYVKTIHIKPILDLSNFKKSIEEIPQKFNESISNMKEKTKEIGKTLKTSFTKELTSPSIRNAFDDFFVSSFPVKDKLIKPLKKELTSNSIRNIFGDFLASSFNIKNKLIKPLKKELTSPSIKNIFNDFLVPSFAIKDKLIKPLEKEFIPFAQKTKKNFSDIFLGFSSALQEDLFGKISTKTQIKELDYELNKLSESKENLEKTKQQKISTFKDKEVLQEYQNLKIQLTNVEDDYEQETLIKKQISALVKNNTSLNDLIEIEKEINDINQESIKIQKDKERLQKQKPEFDFKSFGEKIYNNISNVASQLINKLSNSLKNFFKDVKSEFEEMASYSLSTSLRVNETARNRALMYGLSDAQNYAFEKVSEEMNIGDIEDITLLTPAQQERFAQRIGYYSGKYEELANKDFFRNYEQYIASMNDFKEELRMSVIQFIVDNKDTIMNIMNFIMKSLENIMKFITNISKVLRISPTESQQASTISDVINNYSNSSKVANVKVDNSFNGIQLKDQASIEASIQKANEQLIQALNGNL